MGGLEMSTVNPQAGHAFILQVISSRLAIFLNLFASKVHVIQCGCAAGSLACTTVYHFSLHIVIRISNLD